MKRYVLIIAMTCLAGLVVAGLGMASGENEKGMASEVSGSQMEQTDQSMTTALQLNTEQVRELQKILNDKGFNVGMVDGNIGPETQQALRDFQESAGLTVTGIPDKPTVQALAPDAKTQEFFGLGPAYGEKGMDNEMKDQAPEGQMKSSEDTKVNY